MYVIKFSNNTYWCGCNQVGPQLCEAVIYPSVRACESSAKSALARLLFVDRVPKGTTYKIVEVELKEVLN